MVRICSYGESGHLYKIYKQKADLVERILRAKWSQDISWRMNPRMGSDMLDTLVKSMRQERMELFIESCQCLFILQDLALSNSI